MEENLNEKADKIKLNKKMLTGMFADRESLEKAYEALNERNYSKDEINVIMSDETRKKYFPVNDSETDITTVSAENATKGVVIGSTIGAIAGVVGLVASGLIVPGLGVLVAGSFIVALSGAGVGVVAGGIIGLLIGLQIPEQYTKVYESGIVKGYIVLGVHPHNEEDAAYFKKTWLAYKGEEIHY